MTRPLLIQPTNPLPEVEVILSDKKSRRISKEQRQTIEEFQRLVKAARDKREAIENNK